MSHYLFVAGFCLLLVHEMDAVRLGEWKIFPLVSGMREESGYVTFAALRVPIYALLLLGLLKDGGTNEALILGLDVFFVVHVVLHLVFRNHPENRFGSPFSWALILGAGVCGTADLLASLAI